MHYMHVCTVCTVCIENLKFRLIFTLVPQGVAQYFCGISIFINQTICLLDYNVT